MKLSRKPTLDVQSIVDRIIILIIWLKDWIIYSLVGSEIYLTDGRPILSASFITALRRRKVSTNILSRGQLHIFRQNQTLVFPTQSGSSPLLLLALARSFMIDWLIDSRSTWLFNLHHGPRNTALAKSGSQLEQHTYRRPGVPCSSRVSHPLRDPTRATSAAFRQQNRAASCFLLAAICWIDDRVRDWSLQILCQIPEEGGKVNTCFSDWAKTS